MVQVISIFLHTGPRRSEIIMDMENGLLDSCFFDKELAFYFRWRNYREAMTANKFLNHNAHQVKTHPIHTHIYICTHIYTFLCKALLYDYL